MSVREIIDDLGSEFKKLSTYDRVVKARKEFPDLTNKQLAEDIVICPVQKLRKHLAKARKQGVLPEAVEEPLKERAFSLDSSLASKVHSIGWKDINERDSENDEALPPYKISNQYRMIPKEKLYADEAYELSIGDKVIIEGKDEKKEHAICERFDIKKDKWKLRMQSSFQESSAERNDIEVFEVLNRKNAAKILSKASKNDMVFSVERTTEYSRGGKKFTMPLTEIIKRPNRSVNMPLLYQERPTWTVDEAKVLLSKCGLNVSFMIDMFMQQKEADAKWKDFCYVNKVSQCNILTSNEEEENTKYQKSLGKWNNNLHTAGFQQIQIRTPYTEQSKLGFEEFMKTFGFPTINQSQRKKSRLGLSFDFIPQVCDYCDHHAVSMPVCECGESYCGPACRLAEWNNHSNICEQAMENMMMVGMIDKLWMITKGYKTDCEGRVISMKS